MRYTDDLEPPQTADFRSTDSLFGFLISMKIYESA